MKMMRLGLVLVILLAVVVPAEAQLWSGYFDSKRGIDWQSIPYTKPNANWPICGTVWPAGSTAAQLNNAIATCPPFTYVQLADGITDIGSGVILIQRSSVEFRGTTTAGTKLRGDGTAACKFGKGLICVGPSTLATGYVGGTGVYTSVNITAGVTQGATTITLASTANLTVGQVVVIDQNNEDLSSIQQPFITCGPAWAGCVGSTDGTKGTQQWVEITNINSGANQITFTPGLYFHRWNQSLSPTLKHFHAMCCGYQDVNAIKDVGVSNMTIESRAPDVGQQGVIGVSDVNGGWVERVAFNVCNNTCIDVHQFRKFIVGFNYLYKSTDALNPSSHYGIAFNNGTDGYAYSNICHLIQACIIGNGGASAVIVAYNYAINLAWGTCCDNWNNPSWYPNHAVGQTHWLMEGNDGTGTSVDQSHGTGGLHVSIRNFMTGSGYSRSTLVSFNTVATVGIAFNRWNSWLGNVLGTPGVQNRYETSPATGDGSQNNNGAIYFIGNCGATFASTCGTLNTPGDALYSGGTYRYGNYDTVNAAVRYLASEIPADQSVPSGGFANNVPASFYLTAKPSWFGTINWPPIGPDITSGPSTVNGFSYGGRVNKIPARVCWETTMGGSAQLPSGFGPFLTFDPEICYAGGGSTPPPPPPTQNFSPIINLRLAWDYLWNLVAWVFSPEEAYAGSALYWGYDTTSGKVIPATVMIERAPSQGGPFTVLATVPALPSQYTSLPATPDGLWYRIEGPAGMSNVVQYLAASLPYDDTAIKASIASLIDRVTQTEANDVQLKAADATFTATDVQQDMLLNKLSTSLVSLTTRVTALETPSPPPASAIVVKTLSDKQIEVSCVSGARPSQVLDTTGTKRILACP